MQAARIIQQKESFPDETRAGDQSEKEQRVEDHSHELSERHEDEDQREAELQAEWILLLHALDLDPSSQFSHLLDEVGLTYIFIVSQLQKQKSDRGFNMLFNAGEDEACASATGRDD